MNSVNSTYDLYETLTYFSIPVMENSCTVREMTDIIGDMLCRWRECQKPEDCRRLIDALEFLVEADVYFKPEQAMAFLAIRDEQKDIETFQDTEASTDLDAYLDSFKITRG